MQLKPDVLGSVPGGATFFSAQCRFKGLQTVMTLIVSFFDKLPSRSSDVAPSIGPGCVMLRILSFSNA